MNANRSKTTVRQETKGQTSTAAQKVSVIKLAVDVHAAKYKISRQVGDLPAQPPQTMEPEEYIQFAKKQLTMADEVHSCYEAGPTGFWLHRRLVELGIKNLVVVPCNLDAYGKRINDDRNDARRLGLKLSRYVAGEKEALAVVMVPSLEMEQRRAVTRQRSQLAKVVRSLAAMGRGFCLLHGHRIRGSWWKARSWGLLQKDLPPWMVEHLERFRPPMLSAEKEIAVLTKGIQQAAPPELPAGLGQMTYEQIEREVVDWNRFHNRKEPGSFAGLCGGVSASGQTHRDLSLTKHGNRRLRAILIELAWRMVFFQPNCHAVARWKALLRSPNGHARRRKQLIVAVARQLLVDLWRWRTGQTTPEKLGWVMRATGQGQPVTGD